MRFVLSFIKVLKMSRLFRQHQDQDHFSCPRGASKPRPRSRDYISVFNSGGCHLISSTCMFKCALKHYSSKFQSHKAHAERQTLKFNSHNMETYNTAFSIDELLDALSSSNDSAVGPDDTGMGRHQWV